jgi:hypothetical protein
VLPLLLLVVLLCLSSPFTLRCRRLLLLLCDL